MAAIETDDIKALSTAAVRGLSTDAIVALTTEQAAALSTSQVAALTTAQVAAIETADIKALVKSMSDFLASQKSIAFDMETDLEIVTTDGQRLSLASSEIGRAHV